MPPLKAFTALLLCGVVLSLLYALIAADTLQASWRYFALALVQTSLILLFTFVALTWAQKVAVFRGFAGLAVFVIVVVSGVTMLSTLVAGQFLGFAETVRFFSWDYLRFPVIAAVASSMFMVVLWFQQELRRRVAAEAQANLRSLQSRIRPHFMFNTLNTIASLIHERPSDAEEATLAFSDLLRSAMTEQDRHQIADELQLIKRYLSIESLRLGERLKTDWNIPEDVPLDICTPPLLLQPIVENAIVHGISRRTEGGTLRIEGKRIRFGRIRFTVTNPLADPDSRPAEGNGTALENIRQRLALAYEERYGLKTRIEDGHFIAELTIPVED